jgi:trigger factor
MDPSEFVQALSSNGQIPSMVAEVARNKALAIVLGKAEVVDSNGKPVDLTEFAAVDTSAEVSDEESDVTDESGTTDAAAETETDSATEAEPAAKPAKAAKKPAAKK